MKVLILSKRYPPDIGGIATSVHAMAGAMINNGHQVMILCANEGEPKDLLVDKGILVRRLPYRHSLGDTSFPNSDIRFIKNHLQDVINEFNPDYIWSRWPNYSIALSRSELDTPFIHIPPSAHPVSFDGLLSSLPKNLTKPKVLLNGVLWMLARVQAVKWEKKVLEKCSKTVVFSNNVKKQYTYFYPEYQEKVKVIYPGSDSNRFKGIPFEDAQKSIYDELGITNDRKLFLYVGRLSPEKNVDLLLKSAAKIRSMDPGLFNKLHILIVGDGKHRESLEELAVGLNLNINFCGVQNKNLETYYSAAWSFILPTTHESFGHVLVEAGLCSTPSIAFRPDSHMIKTAADEIIVNNKTGLLITPATCYSLACAIKDSLLWSDDLRSKMGTDARKEILKKFSWDNFVHNMVNI
jgi:glycosyltransferase involved in cell wall biosynthesis